MHWDSSQCRQWCELQKRHRQQGGAAGQPGQDAGSEDSAEDAEEAGVQGKPDQASILDKQQQGEHSAAAAVQPALAEEPVKQVGPCAELRCCSSMSTLVTVHIKLYATVTLSAACSCFLHYTCLGLWLLAP